ncbi:fumarylacetoacetate hydrolase family protein [Paraburkholderia tropica]|uniref:fumarylacetoacetate hydrolase family protein n=1 Tax=Paraburkholderia tropica TaxID=92647 RepID=UPI002AB7A113|nr:fumarylacetoacetate hydrolase family protein [Paraburkholderia tropica]
MITRWCRFLYGAYAHNGRIEGDTIHTITAAPWLPHAETGETYALSDVRLLPPVLPPTFYCVGQNYRSHIIESAQRKGIEPKFPARPDVNFRSAAALCAHGDAIIKPTDAGELFQYEGELVVVIGRQGKLIAADRALEHVFGWTVGNDVSERTWQRSDRTNWRAKNADTFNPMGPWIVSGVDYRAMTTTVRVNGEEVDCFATGDMIHDVETYITEISKYCTLYPGDVIWMGTDGSPRNLKPGDLCEIEISGIGTLANPVVAASFLP